ncbi:MULTISPECIES: HD domain-containing protein [unclassified Bacillus (in: firmicutes)]|uniref:HD domain-containing protein n=1 Tax=unclassified Bacillus (in: firmicutes) TaxID=185979 RepID=UPI0008E0392D|nr:HD domain-containing protein [Bacillus sp. UNCCL13]SFQ83613.1 HD domain-containing protein [Bacillus sp. cl95]
MELIEKALQVASQSHEGQYRKDTTIPYITHPVAVGMMLMKAGYSEEIIAAGILHDTVEDTTVTLNEIRELFGERIASIVEGCSEPDKSLSWEERKTHTIEYLKNAPEEIRVVACADKLHNIQSIINDYEQFGDKVWNRFNRGREQQEWYYTNIIESLAHESDFSLVNDLRDKIAYLFKQYVVNEDDFSATEDAGLDKDDMLGRVYPGTI